MIKKDLMTLVAGAYPGAFPATRAQARRHVVGDTLADFVYLELDETQSETVDFDEAERVLQRAIDDLEQVIDAVRDAHVVQIFADARKELQK